MSVIVARGRHGVAEAVASLSRQDFPLDRVELVLAGVRMPSERHPFGRVTACDAVPSGYYPARHMAAMAASAPVLGFLDSDVEAGPAWLATLVSAIEAGATVATGPTFMRGRAHAAVRLVVGSLMGGYTVGRDLGPGVAEALGANVHACGIEAAAYRRHGLVGGGPHSDADVILWRALQDEQATFRWLAGQRTARTFDLRWWLTEFQPKLGFERTRSRPERWPLRSVFAAAVGTVAFDLRQWWRFARLSGLTRHHRLRLLPLMLTMSAVSQAARIAGGLLGLMRPDAMARWAATR